MVTQSQQIHAPSLMDSRMLLGKERAELASHVFARGIRALMVTTGGAALVLVIGTLDFYTGPEISFAIFYLIPIALAAWWGGFAQGILIATACSISWQCVETIEGTTRDPIIELWNGVARFGVFVIASSLLSRLRISLYLEKKLARSDQLTGAANGRTFYEQVSQAVERSLRSDQPLTLAYLDLDNFKWLNDNLGHATGDQALCELVRTVNSNIRATDQFARLGGDEFALMFPDCGKDEATAILARLQKCFSQEMEARKWPVTISIGAMTFPQPMRDVDALVRRVDDLMFKAKKQGKNRIVHLILRNSEREIEIAVGKVVERRATARVLCDRPARVRSEVESEGIDEPARVRDISTSGLCIHMERALPEQTLIAIEPLHASGAKTLLVRVMWALPEGGGWLHECVLPNRLSADELALWVRERNAESFHESR